MQESIAQLYSVFAPYHLGNDFAGCPCCVTPRQSAALAAKPLRHLTAEDVEHYATKAMTTWGNVRHFKHFLPRLLELCREHEPGNSRLWEGVFERLGSAHWESWPPIEQAAVEEYLQQLWKHRLNEPVYGCSTADAPELLCFLACACTSVQRFLDDWLHTRKPDAARALAALVYENSASLIKKRQLAEAFWNVQGEPHREVIAWLQSDAVLNYLTWGSKIICNDDPATDFNYALPQLQAIRAALK
ncbi:hypothetical protein NA78x_002557 [Anatilimnocola sp. NA78]|uniref:hypothetical protein n=1 Tax=Anatilimnocola sp. NA78 TaxID=3415683 RepID=UPI003CE53D45